VTAAKYTTTTPTVGVTVSLTLAEERELRALAAAAGYDDSEEYLRVLVLNILPGAEKRLLDAIKTDAQEGA